MVVLQNGFLATSNEDQSIKIWDSDNFVTQYQINCYAITLVALQNGNLVSICSDSTVQVWNTNSGSLITSTGDYVSPLAALPNGYLASCVDKDIKVWDTDTGSLIKTLSGHVNSVVSLVVLKNGYLTSQDAIGNINIWNITTGDLVRNIIGQSIFLITELQNGYLVSWYYPQLKIWNRDNGSFVKNITFQTQINTLAALPNGNLATACNDFTIKIWKPETAELITTLTGHAYHVYSLVILQNGYLASLSSEVVKIWRTDNLNNPLSTRMTNSTFILTTTSPSTSSSNLPTTLLITTENPNLCNFICFFSKFNINFFLKPI